MTNAAATGDIVIDYVGKRGDAAIVHVGREVEVMRDHDDESVADCIKIETM